MDIKSERIKRLTAYIFMVSFNILLISIYWKSGNLGFVTNDDMAIAMIPSGILGDYSPYLSFSNIILGYLLVFLTKTVPLCNWTILFFVLIIMSSYIVLSFWFIRSKGALFGTILAMSFELITANSMLKLMNFTKTAAIAVIAGEIVFVYTLSQKNNHSKLIHYVMLILSSIIIVIGSMIRFESYLMLLPFTLIVILYEYMHYGDKLDIKKNLMALISAVLIVILPFLFYSTDRIIYNLNEEWKIYREFNAVRAANSDYQSVDYWEYADEFKQNGISEIDYLMITNGYAGDFENLNTNKLILAKRITRNHIKIDIIQCFKNISQQFADMAYLPSLALIFVVAILVLSFSPENFWYESAVVLLTACEIMAFQLIGRSNERVVVSVAIAGIVTLIYLWNTNRCKILLGRVGITVVILNLIMSFFLGGIINLQSKSYENNKDNYLQFLDYVSSRDADVYVWEPNSPDILVDALDPFDRLPVGVMHNSVYAGGWTFGMPITNKVMQKHGYDNNVYRMLAEDHTAYLVEYGHEYALVDMKLRYIREHYGDDIACSMSDTQNGFYMYSFSKPMIPMQTVNVDWSIDSINMLEHGESHVGISGFISMKQDNVTYYLNVENDDGSLVRSYRILPVNDRYYCEADLSDFENDDSFKTSLVWEDSDLLFKAEKVYNQSVL